MSTFHNYRRYRALQLRNAWILAGIDRVIYPFLRGALLAFLLLIAYGVVSRRVEAAQTSAVSQQAAYIKSLEAVLAKCLSGGDNAIKIGDEVWMCGSTNTGIKVK